MINSVKNVDYNTLTNRDYFKHKQNDVKNNNDGLSASRKIGIAAMSAVGTLSTVPILAKMHHTPLNLKKFFKTPLKEHFLAKMDYGVKEVLIMGAGSCIGGYLGGLIFDKNKQNRQAKKRETLIQYTNISLPIITVGISSKIGKFLGKKMPKALTESKSKGLKLLGKTPKILMPLAGLFAGIYIGNRASNKINQKIYNSKEDRPVKASDFSVHIDDLCVASQYIAPNSVISKGVSRIIPLALMVPGYEIGKKQEVAENK